MLTLVLLMTAAASAWATDPKVYSGPVAITSLQVGDILAPGFSLTGDNNSSIQFNAGRYRVHIEPGTDAIAQHLSDIVYINYLSVIKTDDGKEIIPVDGNGQDGYAWEVTAVGSGIHLSGIYYTAAIPTTNANEWTMVMPAGNVLLTVEYKDLTTTAVTYGGVAIPDAGVTAYRGFESEFAKKLAATVTKKNSDPAVYVETTATSFTYTSSNPEVIAFVQGDTLASGLLSEMVFLAPSTNPVTLTVEFNGDGNYCKSSTTFDVTVGEKLFDVMLTDGNKDTGNWKVKIGDAEDFGNFPLTNVKVDDQVTVKYEGTLKVDSVKAKTLLATILSSENTSFTSGKDTLDGKVIVTFSDAVVNAGEAGWTSDGGITMTVTCIEGYAVDSCKFYRNQNSSTVEGASPMITLDNEGVTKIEVYGYARDFVKPDLTRKIWTLEPMLKDKVNLQVEYYPVAVFDTNVAGNKLPTAVTGIAAGSMNTIITDDGNAAQGKLMYKVTTTEAKPETKEGFSDAIPTALNLPQGSVYVWCYVAGDETHNDSEIFTTPITVSLLASAPHEIIFANDSTAPNNKWLASVNSVPVDSAYKDAIVKLKYIGEKRLRSITLRQRVNYTAPTRRSGLTFNGNQNNPYGSPQMLINAGVVEDGTGTIYYSYKYNKISQGNSNWNESNWSEWSTNVPQGTNAGYYKIRYKIVPAEGYGGVDVTELSGSVTINKAQGYIQLSSYSSNGWFLISQINKYADITITHHPGTVNYTKQWFNGGNEYLVFVTFNPDGGNVRTQHSAHIYLEQGYANGLGYVYFHCPETDNYTAKSATYTCWNHNNTFDF